MTFSFLVPNISGNICAASTIQQKEDTTVAVSPFLLLPLLQRLTNHYYKQMHTIRIGTSDAPEAHGSSCRTGLIAVKTIVSIAQHYLGELVERVVYA